MTPSTSTSAVLLTGELIDHLEAGRWDEVRNVFDEALLKALDRDTLSAVWTQIVTNAGALRGHSSPFLKEGDGETVVTSRLVFDRTQLLLCVVFHPDLAVAGLTIRPEVGPE